MSGPSRHARWLGEGLIAVAGVDYHVSGTREKPTVTTAPAGVQLIDTRTWTVRTIDERATSVLDNGDVVLAFGATWDALTEETRGMGLAAYGRDGVRRFHALGNEPVWWAELAGPYAYVLQNAGTPEKRVLVLDLRSGEVLRVVRVALPSILGRVR